MAFEVFFVSARPRPRPRLPLFGEPLPRELLLFCGALVAAPLPRARVASAIRPLQPRSAYGIEGAPHAPPSSSSLLESPLPSSLQERGPHEDEPLLSRAVVRAFPAVRERSGSSWLSGVERLRLGRGRKPMRSTMLSEQLLKERNRFCMGLCHLTGDCPRR